MSISWSGEEGNDLETRYYPGMEISKEIFEINMVNRVLCLSGAAGCLSGQIPMRWCFCGESDLAQTRPSIYKLRDSVSSGVWSNYDVVVTRLGGDECMSQSVCTVTTAACHIMGNLWTAEIGFSQCWEQAVQDQCARTAGFWWEPSSRSQIAETSLCPRVMKERGSLWCLLYKSISHTHHGPTLVT